MALMDTLINTAASALSNNSGNSQNTMVDMAMELIQKNGGVGNLMNQLQQGGLGDALGSWVSTNQENAAVSGSDLQSALGGDMINQIAQKFGMDGQQAGDLLAKVLPGVVDSATPNGNAQDADGFGLDDLASLALKNFIK